MSFVLSLCDMVEDARSQNANVDILEPYMTICDLFFIERLVETIPIPWKSNDTVDKTFSDLFPERRATNHRSNQCSFFNFG